MTNEELEKINNMVKEVNADLKVISMLDMNSSEGPESAVDPVKEKEFTKNVYDFALKEVGDKEKLYDYKLGRKILEAYFNVTRTKQADGKPEDAVKYDPVKDWELALEHADQMKKNHIGAKKGWLKSLTKDNVSKGDIKECLEVFALLNDKAKVLFQTNIKKTLRQFMHNGKKTVTPCIYASKIVPLKEDGSVDSPYLGKWANMLNFLADSGVWDGGSMAGCVVAPLIDLDGNGYVTTSKRAIIVTYFHIGIKGMEIMYKATFGSQEYGEALLSTDYKTANQYLNQAGPTQAMICSYFYIRGDYESYLGLGQSPYTLNTELDRLVGWDVFVTERETGNDDWTNCPFMTNSLGLVYKSVSYNNCSNY